MKIFTLFRIPTAALRLGASANIDSATLVPSSAWLPPITPILRHSISSFGFHGFINHVFHVELSRSPAPFQPPTAQTLAQHFPMSNPAVVGHALLRVPNISHFEVAKVT